jgi:X-Pro dipeptidyl-peptidase
MYTDTSPLPATSHGLRTLVTGVACLVLLLATVSLGATARVASAQTPEPDTIVVADGVTQPVFSYADAVREVVQVTSPINSHDGDEPDIITVDIIRPAASDGDLRVPTILIPSPYYCHNGPPSDCSPTAPGRGRQAERKPSAPPTPSIVVLGANHGGSRMTGSRPLTGQTGTLIDCGLALSPSDCPEGSGGAIAIVERGGATFTVKAQNALAAGAAGVVVYNDVAGPFTGSVTAGTPIAVLAIDRAAGLALLDELAAGTVEANLRELFPPIDRFPLYYDNVFVPRGYAIAQVDLPGSRASTGCIDVGGPAEADGTAAVVEWLAGEGVHAVNGTTGQPVTADWSNGKVAMIGKSWDGTIPIAVAARAPQGLATIVPIAGLSEWHSDFWDNGTRYGGSPTQWHDGQNNNPAMRQPNFCTQTRAHLAAEQNNPDPGSAFWQERNWTKDVGNFEASVLIVHGMNDYNVKPVNFGRLWEALAEHGVPRKMWLSQVAHEKAFDFRRDEWLTTIHRWFDYWLQGIDNGIADEPKADVEHEPGVFTAYDDWPNGSKDTKLWFGRSYDAEDPRLYTLRPDARDSEPVTTADFSEIRRSATQFAQNQFAEDTDNQGRVRRLAFLSDELTKPVHVSGETTVDLEVKIAGPNAQSTTFSALLVDYGTAPRVQHTVSGGVLNVGGTTCFGQGTTADTGCYQNVTTRVHAPAFEVVSRGWAQIGFQLGVTSIDPEETYRLTFGLQHHDYVFRPGHRIGLVIAGPETHLHNSRHPTSNRPVELQLGPSRVQLPVVGGPPALRNAFR